MKAIYQLLERFFDERTKIGRRGVVALSFLSIFILTVTSLYVGYKSALVQNNNSDQLIDGYLFENFSAFNNALFPAAHTFLLKWPIFALTSLLGNTSAVYVIFTVALYLITIFGLLFVVYRITDKNRIITSFITLALSSILLLVPPQPHEGSFLPVNMAMLTTRNIEFLLLFLYIFLAHKATSLKSVYLYGSILLLGLLAASDKLFLALTLGAAIFQLVYLLTIARIKFNKTLLYPTIATAGGYLLSTIIPIIINKIGLTHIPNPGTSTPFPLVTSLEQIQAGVAGAVSGIITNFGAGFTAQPIKYIAPYFINGLVLLSATIAVIILFTHPTIIKRCKEDMKWRFALWLVGTLAVSLFVFIASAHDYKSDARYLTIVLFTGVISLAYVLNILKSQKLNIVILAASMVLTLTSPISLLAARFSLNRSIDTNQKEFGIRTDQAANIVMKEKADLLVADYWFISPTKLKVNHDLQILPMSTDSCDQPNFTLISTAWAQPSREVQRSAYYILRDAGDSATTFNHGCELSFLDKKYGKYEKEFIIRGDETKPIDIIRIYNYDIRTNIPH